MKKIILLLFNLIIYTSIFSQDFRKATWGMSIRQVKETETNEIVEESSDYLVFKTSLASIDAYAIYIFVGDKLTRGKYLITETHSNKNDYISDYKKLNGLLNKKYNEPIENEIFWKNDLYKNDYPQWGFAISIGHLIYYSKYKTSNTEINIMLSGDNYEINNSIEYKSIELEKLEKETINNELLNNFSLYGFRNNSWGDSLVLVKSKEEYDLIQEEPGFLVYKGRLAGMDMLLGYFFTQNKLSTGKYLVSEDHSNKNDYIIDYEKLKNLLIQKYGKPKEDEKFWKNDLYQDDYSQWGFAISLGHLIYYSTFQNEMTEIILMLSGENYKIDLRIEFKSVELKGLEEKSKEIEVLDDF